MAKQTVQPRKRRGPPPTGKGVPVQVRLQPELLARLDGWIAAQEDKPSRPEALRRLASKALAQESITACVEPIGVSKHTASTKMAPLGKSHRRRS